MREDTHLCVCVCVYNLPFFFFFTSWGYPKSVHGNVKLRSFPAKDERDISLAVLYIFSRLKGRGRIAYLSVARLHCTALVERLSLVQHQDPLVSISVEMNRTPHVGEIPFRRIRKNFLI